eukprot:4893968-Amphidinium_carterae.1
MLGSPAPWKMFNSDPSLDFSESALYPQRLWAKVVTPKKGGARTAFGLRLGPFARWHRTYRSAGWQAENAECHSPLPHFRLINVTNFPLVDPQFQSSGRAGSQTDLLYVSVVFQCFPLKIWDNDGISARATDHSANPSFFVQFTKLQCRAKTNTPCTKSQHTAAYEHVKLEALPRSTSDRAIITPMCIVISFRESPHAFKLMQGVMITAFGGTGRHCDSLRKHHLHQVSFLRILQWLPVPPKAGRITLCTT